MKKMIRYNIFNESRQYIKQLISDGKISPVMVELFKKFDPTDNKKFVPWIIRQYLKDPEKTVSHNTKDLLDKYVYYTDHELTDKRDINVFKTIEELEEHLKGLENKKSIKQLRKEKNIIIDNEYITLYRPDNNESCRQLAFSVLKEDDIEPKWCIIPKNSLEWNRYYKDRKFTFYILQFKKLPEEYKNDPILDDIFTDKYKLKYYKALGIAIEPDGTINHIENKKPDVHDRQLTRNEIMSIVNKKWGDNKILKDTLVPYNVENRN